MRFESLRVAFSPEFELPEAAHRILQPTVENRIRVYDLIRGVAILGILLANIPWFASPELSRMEAMANPSPGIDAAVAAWTSVFVSGKFRGMLAILFGIGLWMQYRKRSAIPGNWPLGYMKRMLILAGFGLFHGIFIWHGDILLMYACIGFVACLFIGFSDRVFKWLLVSYAVVILLIGAGSLVLPLVFDWHIAPKAKDVVGSLAEEIRIHAQGSYLDQLLFRMKAVVSSLAQMILVGPMIGGLFLLGVKVGQAKILERPSREPHLRNVWLAVGLGLGLALNSLAGYLSFRLDAVFILVAVEMGFGAILACGYLMLLAMWSESGRFGVLQRALEAVGRTAFSCYILQSIVSTAIFYSWGFGLFGRFDRLQMLAFVPLVGAIDVLFALIWLRFFRMGPLEWLWRSLTEGQRLPLRREG